MQLKTAIQKYKQARKYLWVQEEPENMGAWFFVRPRLEKLTGEPIEYVGRKAASSPATGFPNIYRKEQSRRNRQRTGSCSRKFPLVMPIRENLGQLRSPSIKPRTPTGAKGNKNHNKGASMKLEIKIPSVGESVQEAVLVEWYKKDGDNVQKDEPLFVVETDKVTLEIVAEASGVLKILISEGQTVGIGAVVGTIDTEAAPAPPPEPKPPKKDKIPSAPPVEAGRTGCACAGRSTHGTGTARCPANPFARCPTAGRRKKYRC